MDRARRLNFPAPIAVVLVAPEQGANVGFIARTLACYGIVDLRIVGNAGIQNEKSARMTGAGALEILDSTRDYLELSHALADCGAAYGFTRRLRDPAQTCQDLDAAASEWTNLQTDRKSSGWDSSVLEDQDHASVSSRILPTALVFGRESQGLSRSESLAMTHLVTIPMASPTLSLNLSHAVSIVLYAFATASVTQGLHAAKQGQGAANVTDRESALPARADSEVALLSILNALEQRRFFRGAKAAAQKDAVRLLWQRLRPDQRELDFLVGLLKALGSQPIS